MSELKEHQFCRYDEIVHEYSGNFPKDLHLYYLKSEADKEIAELKNYADEVNKDFDLVDNQNERLLKIVRHQKYKRCLAMARWCERKRIDAADYRIPREKWKFYDRWHKRWLDLAEKFKEAK